MKVSCNAPILIHFISNNNNLVRKEFSHSVPRVGDEIRFGLAGYEKFYQVIKVVWAFDEESLFQRVNVGIKELSSVELEMDENHG